MALLTKEEDTYENEDNDDNKQDNLTTITSSLVQIATSAQKKETNKDIETVLNHILALYKFDTETTTWQPADGGSSRVSLFHHLNQDKYRIVARSSQQTFVLNHWISPQLKFKSLSDKFIILSLK